VLIFPHFLQRPPHCPPTAAVHCQCFTMRCPNWVPVCYTLPAPLPNARSRSCKFFLVPPARARAASTSHALFLSPPTPPSLSSLPEISLAVREPLPTRANPPPARKGNPDRSIRLRARRHRRAPPPRATLLPKSPNPRSPQPARSRRHPLHPPTRLPLSSAPPANANAPQ
jgi:hypothetical protein